MAAVETISGFVTNAGAVDTIVIMAPGDSPTVRNFSSGYAYLLNVFTRRLTAGFTRIRSPRLHDNVNGIRLDQDATAGSASTNYPLLPMGFVQPLIAQDTLTLSMTGQSGAGLIDSTALTLYYPNLDSANGRFIDSTQLAARLKNYVGNPVSVTAGTAGGWSGAAAINSLVDILKANTDYAIIGGTIRATAASKDVCAISIKGVDTGNLRIAFPGNNLGVAADLTTNYFQSMSDRCGKPMIPVVNSANKAGIYVECVNDNLANTIVVTLIMAELA